MAHLRRSALGSVILVLWFLAPATGYTLEGYDVVADLVRQVEYWRPDLMEVGSPCRLYRVVGDLNNDHVPDLAISSVCAWGDHGPWGNAGGSWLVYLAATGARPRELHFVGELSGKPTSWTVYPGEPGQSIVTTWWRSCVLSGGFARYRVSSAGVEHLGAVPFEFESNLQAARVFEREVPDALAWGSCWEFCNATEFRDDGVCRWAPLYPHILD